MTIAETIHIPADNTRYMIRRIFLIRISIVQWSFFDQRNKQKCLNLHKVVFAVALAGLQIRSMVNQLAYHHSLILHFSIPPSQLQCSTELIASDLNHCNQSTRSDNPNGQRSLKRNGYDLIRTIINYPAVRFGPSAGAGKVFNWVVQIVTRCYRLP